MTNWAFYSDRAESLAKEMTVMRRKLESAKRFISPDDWDKYIEGVKPKEATNE